MKNNGDVESNVLFDEEYKKLNDFCFTYENRSQDFNASASLVVILSLFVLFFMFSIVTIMSFGVKINLMPLLVAIILSITVGITIIFLSHVINVIDALINK